MHKFSKVNKFNKNNQNHYLCFKSLKKIIINKFKDNNTQDSLNINDILIIIFYLI